MPPTPLTPYLTKAATPSFCPPLFSPALLSTPLALECRGEIRCARGYQHESGSCQLVGPVPSSRRWHWSAGVSQPVTLPVS